MLDIPLTIAALPKFLTPEPTGMLYTLIVFVLLLGIVWKFGFGPIMHALETREKNIQGTIDAAAARMAEAEARVAEYERKLNASKDEAAKIIAEGKRDVDAIVVEEKAKAKVEIEADKERAKREISLAKDAAVAELRDRVVLLTGDIAAKVIGREINKEDHSVFITKALSEIGSKN